MADDCIVPGWGSGVWGTTPWGGSLTASPGGPLPTVPPFDIYCVGPCGPMGVILSHPEVSTVGAGSQFDIDPVTEDLIIQGGGGALPTTEAQLFINTAVPPNWTLDWTCQFISLPTNFNDLANSHIFIGASDANGPCAGLFFSKTGIAYAGSLHLDGGGNMVLDSSLQILPDSQVLIGEGEYFSFRIAASKDTGVVYIYVTKTSDLLAFGHQLRFILPAIMSDTLATVPPDRTLLSVRGTLATLSSVSLDTICLGTGLIIPNLAPIADAGIDQAVRLCSVVQLDGTKSFDPEGAVLTYQWRLVDAPQGSQFAFEGSDGITYPLMVPTGFTDRLYSVEAENYNNDHTILAGDILVVAGEPQVVVSTGTDGNGFYVRVSGFVLPDNLAGAPFKILPQAGLSGADTAKPTFFPDVAGIYKFTLFVSDGALVSLASNTIVNVTESAIPRGIIPDLSVLWNYISDFWRLVEGRERLEVFWGSLAQVAATELLSLWQADYSKSLRDVQRTFLRRWLHVDPLYEELLPEETTTKVHLLPLIARTVYTPVATIAGVRGNHLDLTIPSLGGTFTINVPAGPNPTPAELAILLQSLFSGIDARLTIDIVESRSPPDSAVHQTMRIQAPFLVTVASSSTTTQALWAPGDKNGSLTVTGHAVGVDTYVLDDVSLKGLGIGAGDILELGGIGYRVARVIDDPTDFFPFQRIVLLDALPANAPLEGTLGGTVTSTQSDFHNSLSSKGDLAVFEVIDLDTEQVIEIVETVAATSAVLPKVFAFTFTQLADYLANPGKFAVFFSSIRRRTYLPIDALVVDLPTLQEKIKITDDTAVLRRNVDYFIETYRGQACLRFVTADAPGLDVWEHQAPPNRLWAETAYIDNRPTIEGNFGLPADFTLDDLAQLSSNVDYLSAVRGLWYAYFNGPTVFNLRVGAQILLGLPFAEEAGTIEEVRGDFGDQGRILVRDLANTEIVRSYTFPAILELDTNPETKLPYKVGDTVAQFAPLVKGTEVIDWIKDPKWFEGYLQQGSFFEVEKFHKFLVRVDSAAFNLPALVFTRNFVLRIKPRYTFPLFVVQVKLDDTDVETSDEVTYTGQLNFNAGGAFDGLFGQATMLDMPDPSGDTISGRPWRNLLDTGPLTAGPDAPPDPELVYWGVDKNFLCPEDADYGKCSTTYAAPGLPVLDSIFELDMPVFPDPSYVWEGNHIFQIPLTGLRIGLVTTVSTPSTITDFIIDLLADPTTPVGNYTFEVKKNGVTAATFTDSVGPFALHVNHTVNIAVVGTDTLEVWVTPAAGMEHPYWHQLTLTLGTGQDWALDTNIPAGTYSVYKGL